VRHGPECSSTAGLFAASILPDEGRRLLSERMAAMDRRRHSWEHHRRSHRRLATPTSLPVVRVVCTPSHCALGVRDWAGAIGGGRAGLHIGGQFAPAFAAGGVGGGAGLPEWRDRPPVRRNPAPQIFGTGLIGKLRRWIYWIGWQETPEETHQRMIDRPFESDLYYEQGRRR